MTGYGDARAQGESISVSVETRSINNRYLKINTRCPDAFAAFEGEMEKVVRAKVSRGTVNVSVRIEKAAGRSPYQIDSEVLNDYLRQIQTTGSQLGLRTPDSFTDMLTLPGVLREDDTATQAATDEWPMVKAAIAQSVDKMLEFRTTEGLSMLGDLQVQTQTITDQLANVEQHAPQVVSEFRDRTLERVRGLLTDADVKLDANDLIREVSIFADRCDINEEITRLRSHLEQFDTFLNHKTSQGRKLEFLVQEMFREVNTIGSKANNVRIAHCVVDMKAAIEKMREILQNVE